ncbi:MAG: hypothetical protein NC399_04445 [Muribaculum sp.]|nr:hypothetical protein [Muribaculum sp.]
MKINQMDTQQNITMYVGAQSVGASPMDGEESKQENRKTVFAGNLTQDMTLQDRIEQRKAQARKEAMKVVGDVFEAERSIDEDLENRRTHVQELLEERKVLNGQRSDLEAEKEGLEKALEAGDVSEETYEEMRSVLTEAEKESNRQLAENRAESMAENSVITGTRMERLKKDPMVNAQKEAEAIMEAARDDILGMVQEAGKDHIDAEAEEREEQAEEIKEEREEREELIEKRKEKREEEEELLEHLPMREMLVLDQMQTDVQQEVQDIINRMKLVAEDIKGAAVDTSL